MLAAALAGSAFGAVYLHGRHVERVAQARRARADSIGRAVIVRRDAERHADSTRAIAHVADSASSRGRAQRQTLRAEAEPLLPTWPELAVRLIQTDDRQLERDSITITAHIAADTAAIRERLAAAAVDTLRQHDEAAERSQTGPGWGTKALYATGGFLLAVALTLATAAAH
jgi:hypothetical protein